MYSSTAAYPPPDKKLHKARTLMSVRTIGRKKQRLHNDSSKLIKSDLGNGPSYFLMRQVKTKWRLYVPLPIDALVCASSAQVAATSRRKMSETRHHKLPR